MEQFIENMGQRAIVSNIGINCSLTWIIQFGLFQKLKVTLLTFVQFLRIGKCSATFSGGRQILSLQA